MISEERLVELFRLLGARDADSWARSEAREGIAQLARFVFLRGAWRQILDEGDVGWIDVRHRVPARGSASGARRAAGVATGARGDRVEAVRGR